MQFNSIEFLFCFLPLFLAVYLIIPARLRNAVLILGSLSFYVLSGNGNYWWAGILAVSTALTYFAGLSLAKSGRGKLLALYLSLMGLLLAFFKLYAGGIYLPAGMSFYLFQMAAYLIDVYRLKFVPERDLLAFGAQLTFFPKLLSGPMMDPRRLQLHCRYCTPTYEDFHDGLQELIIGLSLKVLLANRLGGLWAQPSLIGYEHISTPAAWLGLMAFTMQLYFDFYGYSLMAMGLGRMLGYDLPRNFDDPYAAGSVSEFYRRWHVTLGAWFREYLYIPLGGSRKGYGRTCVNLFLTMFLSGIWHGANWTFLVWGALHGIASAGHKIFRDQRKKRGKTASGGLLSAVAMFLLFALLLIPFRAESLGQTWLVVTRIFTMAEGVHYISVFTVIYGLLILGVHALAGIRNGGNSLWKPLKLEKFSSKLILCVFLLLSFLFAYIGDSAFLYAQF